MFSPIQQQSGVKMMGDSALKPQSNNNFSAPIEQRAKSPMPNSVANMPFQAYLKVGG